MIVALERGSGGEIAKNCGIFKMAASMNEKNKIKTLFVLLIFTFLIGIRCTDSRRRPSLSIQDQFNAFIKKFNKPYVNGTAEYLKRLLVFEVCIHTCTCHVIQCMNAVHFAVQFPFSNGGICGVEKYFLTIY
jgi:hypothetical protein